VASQQCHDDHTLQCNRNRQSATCVTKQASSHLCDQASKQATRVTCEREGRIGHVHVLRSSECVRRLWAMAQPAGQGCLASSTVFRQQAGVRLTAELCCLLFSWLDFAVREDCLTTYRCGHTTHPSQAAVWGLAYGQCQGLQQPICMH
jgi:hypothetical protein